MIYLLSVSSVYFVHIANTIVCLPVCNVPLPTITIKTLLPKNLHIEVCLLPLPLFLCIMKQKYLVHPRHWSRKTQICPNAKPEYYFDEWEANNLTIFFPTLSMS